MKRHLRNELRRMELRCSLEVARLCRTGAVASLGVSGVQATLMVVKYALLPKKQPLVVKYAPPGAPPGCVPEDVTRHCGAKRPP